MSVFSPEVVDRVVAHMNEDHRADNVAIARANGFPEAMSVTMTGLDERAGFWSVTDASGTHELAVDWPDGPISERPQIREEVVKVFDAAQEQISFAKRIRETSWGSHQETEGAGFMAGIMRGQAPLADYVALVAQHYFLYEALEAETARHADDPRLQKLDPPALRRLHALHRDLEFLIGTQWRDEIAPTTNTRAYVDRIREVSNEGWIEGLIAHHYTRYLGDLSGGQMIAKRMREQHGFASDGVAFYEFDELGAIPEFKDAYRAELDRVGLTLDEAGQQRFLDEVGIAYRFNTGVFEDLASAKAGAASQATAASVTS